MQVLRNVVACSVKDATISEASAFHPLSKHLSIASYADLSSSPLPNEMKPAAKAKTIIGENTLDKLQSYRKYNSSKLLQLITIDEWIFFPHFEFRSRVLVERTGNIISQKRVNFTAMRSIY